METPPSQPPAYPPATSTAPSSKKGLGTGAKVGIGCALLLALIVLALIVGSFMVGDKLKNFAEDAEKNPTRAIAAGMVAVSFGGMEMVAEDDENMRYTVKDTKTGNLMTYYWDEAKKSSEFVIGDFSAIPTTGQEVDTVPDVAVPEPLPDADVPEPPSGE